MRLHRYCDRCGWRKGGLDSWDGKACKCKIAEPPMPETISGIDKRIVIE